MLHCRRPWCSSCIIADSTAALEVRNLVITSEGQVPTCRKNWSCCSCERPCCWTVCFQVTTQSLCLLSSGMYIIFVVIPFCVYICDDSFYQTAVESLCLGFQTFVITHFNAVASTYCDPFWWFGMMRPHGWWDLIHEGGSITELSKI